ncbi:hypothetical protein P691DRAFT_802676 [Macrolepiota fuliginosa MF-IS2]|uniref:Uncharacterized protein n=1 Tax=Macrolepiota fuliginosa MF-IS2 TaxID=1400762 RepID=A0A9P6C0E2_9AGAR|nr:hypothetical protein P691DRAFT_802676 [Macrolepiota fuliginosa MF-IS2]
MHQSPTTAGLQPSHSRRSGSIMARTRVAIDLGMCPRPRPYPDSIWIRQQIVQR